MRIAYITAQVPWGRGESFILEEMLEIKHQGIDLLIIPRNPSREVFHEEGKELLENSIWLPMLNLTMIAGFFLELFSNISLWRVLWKILVNSRNPKILIKNIMVVPKAVFIAKEIKKTGVSHVHAHWGSTTATTAYIISQITNIPWSFTLHRWDIYENNMLKEKVRSASFVRCISKKGKADLLGIIGNEYADKVQVVHIGVRMRSADKASIAARYYNWGAPSKKFQFIVPANLLPVKGHEYLIEGVCLLLQNGLKNFHVVFYGDGPLKGSLEEQIHRKGLEEYIKMAGAIPHNILIDMYKSGSVDVVILPSINTEDGQHEGIPVALMEAMSYGIPVISTNTGSISELLSDGAGILVKEKSANELAMVLLDLVNNKNIASSLAIKGYEKVRKEFEIEKTTQMLLQLVLRRKANSM